MSLNFFSLKVAKNPIIDNISKKNHDLLFFFPQKFLNTHCFVITMVEVGFLSTIFFIFAGKGGDLIYFRLVCVNEQNSDKISKLPNYDNIWNAPILCSSKKNFFLFL